MIWSFVCALVILTSASQTMAGAVGSGDLMVVDKDGKEVGGVFDVDASGYFYAVVVVEISPNVFVKMTVWEDGVRGESSVYFHGSNCEGQAYLLSASDVYSDPSRSIFAWSGIAPPGNTVYIADKKADPEVTVLRSYYNEYGGCSAWESSFEAVPAYPIGTLPFSPPFSVARKSPSCPGDLNGDREVKVNEIIIGVNSSLNGCPAASSP